MGANGDDWLLVVLWGHEEFWFAVQEGEEPSEGEE